MKVKDNLSWSLSKWKCGDKHWTFLWGLQWESYRPILGGMMVLLVLPGAAQMLKYWRVKNLWHETSANCCHCFVLLFSLLTLAYVCSIYFLKICFSIKVVWIKASILESYFQGISSIWYLSFIFMMRDFEMRKWDDVKCERMSDKKG